MNFLAGLANSGVWPSRKAPPFNSPVDSAPDHLVKLEIQRRYMNVNNQDLPGEIQNLCLYKEEAQEERNPSTTSISAIAAVAPHLPPPPPPLPLLPIPLLPLLLLLLPLLTGPSLGLVRGWR